MNRKTYLQVKVSSSNGLDGHGCDGDSDLDTLDYCYSSRYQRSVLMLAVHDHVPNRVSIYY